VEPIEVLAGPLSHLAAEAEVRSFSLDHQNTDIAFTGVMDGLPKIFRKIEVKAVVRRIGEHNASEGVLSFEPNGLHALQFLSAAV